MRVLLLWLLAGLIGAGVAYRYFFQAFPEASVNFKVTRSAALDQARSFAVSQGASLDGYQSSIVFNVDDDPKTYLEREVGLEQANRLMSSEVNVWFWDVRFFKPLQREEFRVRVDPAGRMVGFGHILEEAAPGARLERPDALARAQAFLRDALHAPLENYAFLPEESNSTARPNRTDWSFTWERTGFRAKDAPYRLNVQLAGERIAGYQEYLKVPEAWLRSYARLRSSNDFIEELALIPYALLLGAAISVVLALGRHGTIRWSGGLKLGLFITLLYFVNQMNQWPLTRAGYDTNGSYSSFVLGQIGVAIATSVALALLVVIAVLPGEPLYRAGQPDRLRLGAAFSLPGLRTKEFFCSGVIGLCLAGAHIGYVVLFYVIGRRAGVWAPQDLQYSDTLSTALPWLYPLTIGIYAAASEELLFRLFSVRFLLRSTNSRILAVVLPAFAWGFLHSNYPQEPAYTRGIEVGLIGIVAGLVMLRWGILATLTWHYTVDAFLISLSLMRSAGAYSRISGAVVGLGALIPVGIAGILYLARGGFADESALLNRAEPLVEAPAAPEPPAPAPSAAGYTVLQPRTLALLLLCGALGVALFAVKTQALGDFVRFSIDAPQAETRADEVLRQWKVAPAGYLRAATIQYTFDPLAAEYLRRSVGIEGVNRIYRDQVPSAFWTVRYFRDSQKEEYLVVLRPDGALHSVHHVLAETAPGASLPDEQAIPIAETFLREQKGLDLAQWKLVGNASEKLPARTDHTFTWEQTNALAPPVAGDEGAHIRIELKVQGDEVSGYRTFIHIPEEWELKQTQSTLLNTLQSVGFVALLSALGIAVLVVFLRNLKQPSLTSVPWRRLAGWCLPVLVASLATFLTLQPQYLAKYPTQVPFKIYLGTALIGVALGSTLFYTAAFFLFGLAWFFLTHTYGAGRLRGWRGMPAAYYRDALLIGICGFAILAGLHHLPDVAARFWPAPRHSLPAAVPEVLDASQPALYAIAVAITRSFFTVGGLALALGFASWYLRRAWQQTALLLAVAVLLVAPSGSAGDFLQSAAVTFVSLAIIWWGAQRVVRFNVLGYFLMTALLLLAGPALDLLRQPNSFFHANGWALAASGVVLLLWLLRAWQRPANRHTRDTDAGHLA
jgi:Type II CAAX prenyl endopeptidase Rce1-like